MATARTIDTATNEPEVDAHIVQDVGDPGRHNARFVPYGDHVYAVLNALRRTNGDVLGGDVGEIASEWDMSLEAVRAAVRYHERHRALFDAYFLLQDEEQNAWNGA